MTEPPTRILPLSAPRAHRIAAVHALPAWLAEHPHVDTPDTVHATRWIQEAQYADPARRVDEVRRFALANDCEVREGPLWVWAVIPIGTVPGVCVDYTVTTAKANARVLPLPPPSC